MIHIRAYCLTPDCTEPANYAGPHCINHKTTNTPIIHRLCRHCARVAAWEQAHDNSALCNVHARYYFRDSTPHESLTDYTLHWMNKAITADETRQPIPPTCKRVFKPVVYTCAKQRGRPKTRPEKTARVPSPPLPPLIVPAVRQPVQVRATLPPSPTPATTIVVKSATSPANSNPPKKISSARTTAVGQGRSDPPNFPSESPTPRAAAGGQNPPATQPPTLQTKKKPQAQATCQLFQCKAPAKYGYFTDNIKRFCKFHAEIGTYNLTQKYCSFPACTKTVCYKLHGNETCREHAEAGAIKFRGGKCQAEGCNAAPSYGTRDVGRRMFCAEHKTPDMVNFACHCKHPNCYNTPKFGDVDAKRASHCEEHKTPLMANLTLFRCLEPNCMDEAKYYHISSPFPTHCYNHKGDKSHLWREYICSVQTCGRNAIYEQNSKHYCKQHRPDDCEPVPPAQFAEAPRRYCSSPYCVKLPAYGDKGDLCADHKAPNDCLAKKYVCVYCQRVAEYYLDGLYLCQEHYGNFGKNIKARCRICEADDSITDICKRCSKMPAKAEWGIVKYLRESFDYPFVHNKNTGIDCTRARPDMVYSFPMHIIIVEIDENQHQGNRCEDKRINEIVNGIGGRSVVIIRFNPDYYGGKQRDMRSRLALLLETLKANVEPPERFCVKMIQLFYGSEEMSEKDITLAVAV